MVLKRNLNQSFYIKFSIIVFICLTIFVSIYFYNQYRTISIMEDFVGSTVEDVKTWSTSNKIDVTFIKDYDENHDLGIIFDQNVDVSERINKRSNVIVYVSRGKDPGQYISMPDFKNWNIDEIQEWLDENLITNANFEIIVDEDLEPGTFVEYKLDEGVTEENFSESDSIVFVISKPENSNDPIKIPNFIGWSESKVKSWSLLSGIDVEFEEAFSDEIEKGNISNQSELAEEMLTPGTSIIITISKGKVVIVPDFENKLITDVKSWADDNNIIIEYTEVYNEQDKDIVIDQDVSADIEIESDSTINITVSLGNTLKIPNSSSITSLEKWINNKNKQGANLSISKSYEYNSATVGSLINIPSGNIKIGSNINIKISKGPQIIVPDFIDKDISEVKSWASDNDINVKYVEEYHSKDKEIVISQSISDGTKIEANSSITITSSLGNTISIPEFSLLSQLENWVSDINKLGANLSINTIYETTPDTRGTLINPPSGIIEVGSTIDCITSKGPVVNLIDFNGKSKDWIINWADSNNINILFEYESDYNDSYDVDIAVYQDISGDVEQDSNVTVTLSKGSEPIASLIDFINNMSYIVEGNPSETVDNIEDNLKSKGFTNYSVITEYNETTSKGYVISQTEPGDYKISKSIIIKISLGPNDN